MRTNSVIATAVASLCLLTSDALGSGSEHETNDLLLLQTDLHQHTETQGEESNQRGKRDVLVTDLAGDEPALLLEVQHLSKCGGTFVMNVANASVGEASIGTKFGEDGEYMEGEEFVPKDGVFSIGLVRNPYSYLVSLWSYKGEIWLGLSRKEWLTMRSVDQEKGLPAGTSQEDRDRFKKFVYRVSDDEIGLMSLRVYGKYLDNYTVFDDNEWWAYPARDVFETRPREPVQQALASFQAPGQLDCFAHLENLDNDTRHCFELYEQQAGPGSVDWVAFDETVENQGHNPSDHVDCNLFYDDDPELKAFVGKTESEVIRAFGYSAC